MYMLLIFIIFQDGVIKRFRAHTVKSAVKLPADGSGPLEVIFFLKNNLP